MRVEPNDRQRLEQLCRYLTQLVLSAERVQRNTGGQLELKLKTPWRGGITRPLMSPLEVMQRLASLVRSLCRPGAGCLRDASRERLVRGDRLRPVRVADGSSRALRLATQKQTSGGADLGVTRSRRCSAHLGQGSRHDLGTSAHAGRKVQNRAAHHTTTPPRSVGRPGGGVADAERRCGACCGTGAIDDGATTATGHRRCQPLVLSARGSVGTCRTSSDSGTRSAAGSRSRASVSVILYRVT